MDDPEAAFRLIRTELAMVRVPTLKGAAMAWDSEPVAPAIAEDGCTSGDYDDAA
jgi:hypothetical protein